MAVTSRQSVSRWSPPALALPGVAQPEEASDYRKTAAPARTAIDTPPQIMRPQKAGRLAGDRAAWESRAHDRLENPTTSSTMIATGTAHAPHHAPKEWIEKYKGRFDQGWDKVREETLARQIKLGIVPANTQLTKRPDQLAAWDSLSSDQKRLYARMMEVYAGALSHADNEKGTFGK